MILILTYHSGFIDEVITSAIDLFLNLSKRTNIEFKIITDDIGKFISLCKYNRNFGCPDILQLITNDKQFEADTVICSTKFLNDIKIHNIKVQCNKMILLDSLDIIKSYYGLIAPLESPCKDTTLLCNPSNFNMVESFNYYEYYHKFSRERLDTLITPYEQLLYMRRNKDSIHIIDSIYFENIGKIIFEMLYTKNMVTYYSDEIEDGLHYYLKLFGVDGHKDHELLEMSPMEIQDCLFMKDDDTILKFI